ncbi:hypothetical protein L226DRAFT_571398 [Lentinus tigrinus ALCF2SS1-7]|uniref:Uncharacterized protein n=1 Tax=Lentinus tigrinus ALCF2SS1-6 TaxID=1328759 RepID=A0A5C2SE52_9APHY|nr:hypothetical protein L227DRAFT_609883 [Lentinus tigrinus ALCF2SS1-6]RPD74515.1 hypothetical protein L226DRAFT_571398 [Lentinus tigrinus ALCF2SS1-7]
MASRPARNGGSLMDTVDYRTGAGGLETIIEEPEVIRLKPTVVATRDERPDVDVSSMELDGSAVENQHVEASHEPAAPAAAEKKGKLANMLLFSCRRLLAWLAVAEYLGAKEMK